MREKFLFKFQKKNLKIFTKMVFSQNVLPSFRTCDTSKDVVFFGDSFSVVHRLCTDKKKKVILVLKFKCSIYPENQGLIHL